MTEPLVLTVDELRAINRTVGLGLPSFVDTDTKPDIRIDIAAFRGLAARDLVEVDDTWSDLGTIRFTATLDGYVTPCTLATVRVDVQSEFDGKLHHRAVFGRDDADDCVVMTLRPGGLVTLTREPNSVADLVAEWCEIDGLADDPTGEALTVSADAHAAADELALAGDRDAAVAALAEAGATHSAARGWVDAVCGRRGAVAITVTCSIVDGDETVMRSSDLRWLIGPDGTAWRVTPADAPTAHHDGGWEDEEADLLSVVTPVRGGAIRSALGEMFAPVAAVGRRR